MLCKFNITQRGESHKKHDMPCQDWSGSFAVPDEGEVEYVVAIVADGVGSEERSDEGSKIVVDAVSVSLKESLMGEEPIGDMTEVLEDAYEDALDTILDWAGEQGEPFSKFATTLTAAVYDGSTLWYGHAGDDGIVVMRRDGSYEMITERHEGALANSVIPFGVHHWQFGEVSDVAACVLMTDGILDYCVGDQLENNRVKLPFLKPLLYAVWETEEDVEGGRKDWDDFLSSPGLEDQAGECVSPSRAFRDVVKDDLTIALLSNSEAVANLPDYSFDLDAWNEESERFAKMREEELAQLERKRLDEDASYRELIRLGKERLPRTVWRQPVEAEPDGGMPSNDGALTDNGGPHLPVPPDGFDEASMGAAGPVQAPASCQPDGADEWAKAMADGAGSVVRGIAIIGDALGDAVQDLFRKP